jgi:hypothetical protein
MHGSPHIIPVTLDIVNPLAGQIYIQYLLVALR